MLCWHAPAALALPPAPAIVHQSLYLHFTPAILSCHGSGQPPMPAIGQHSSDHHFTLTFLSCHGSGQKPEEVFPGCLHRCHQVANVERELSACLGRLRRVCLPCQLRGKQTVPTGPVSEQGNISWTSHNTQPSGSLLPGLGQRVCEQWKSCSASPSSTPLQAVQLSDRH